MLIFIFLFFNAVSYADFFQPSIDVTIPHYSFQQRNYTISRLFETSSRVGSPHLKNSYESLSRTDNVARSKYYTDAAYRQKVDVFNQLIFKCNSCEKFERILARNLILRYEFPEPHSQIVKKIQEELAFRYFDHHGKFVDHEETDQSLGQVVDCFFKSTFNHETYLKAHSILHDDYSCDVLSREKKGFWGQLFHDLSNVIKNVPTYLANLGSGSSIKSALNNEYNQKLVALIQFCKEGDFEQAYNFVAFGDQLMEEVWNAREYICVRAGGKLPEHYHQTNKQEITISSKEISDVVHPYVVENAQVGISHSEHDMIQDALMPEHTNARTQAFKESIEAPECTTKEYQLSYDIKRLLNEHRISPSLYRICGGNQLQHILHSEFIYILSVFSKINHACEGLSKSKLLSQNLVSSVDLGREHNQLGFIKKAVLFANLSWEILEYSANQLLKAEQDFFIGGLEGSMQAVAHYYNALSHPFKTVKAFVETAHSLATIAEKILNEFDRNNDYTMAQHKEIWEKRWHKIATISGSIRDELSKMTVQELARAGMQAAVEGILLEKSMGLFAQLFKLGTKQISTLAKKVADASEVFEAVATTAEGISVEVGASKQMGKQLNHAIEGASEGLKSGVGTFRKTLLPASATLKQLPKHIADRITAAEKYFMQLFKHHEKEIVENITSQLKKSGLIEKLEAQNINCEWLKNLKIEGIDFKHVLVGDMQKGELMGLHSTILCPEKIQKITISTGKRGTWVGKWLEEGAQKLKNSSFFPVCWDEKKIAEEIIKSLKNIVEIKIKSNKLYIIGKNPEEILISTVVNNNGILETFHPTTRFNGRLWIP